VTIPLPDGLRLAEPIDGRVRISRTNRGVLVDASLSTAIAGTCSRCLKDIEIAMSVDIREEALPTVDIGSGKVLDPKTEPDVARLTDHHELDLATMAGEAIPACAWIAANAWGLVTRSTRTRRSIRGSRRCRPSGSTEMGRASRLRARFAGAVGFVNRSQ
jgi:hypothetical protein